MSKTNNSRLAIYNISSGHNQVSQQSSPLSLSWGFPVTTHELLRSPPPLSLLQSTRLSASLPLVFLSGRDCGLKQPWPGTTEWLAGSDCALGWFMVLCVWALTSLKKRRCAARWHFWINKSPRDKSIEHRITTKSVHSHALLLCTGSLPHSSWGYNRPSQVSMQRPWRWQLEQCSYLY